MVLFGWVDWHTAVKRSCVATCASSSVGTSACLLGEAGFAQGRTGQMTLTIKQYVPTASPARALSLGLGVSYTQGP